MSDQNEKKEELEQQPSMDFWGAESHRPNNPPSESPKTPPANPSNALPPREELIKPFETQTAETLTGASDETPAVKAEETTPPPPPPTPEPEEEPTVRKIGSTTFRRLDEPVDLHAEDKEEAPAVEPIIVTPPAAEPEPTAEAPTPEPEITETATEETSTPSKNLWDGPALSTAPSQAGADAQSAGPSFTAPEPTPEPEAPASVEPAVETVPESIESNETPEADSAIDELDLDSEDDEISAEALDTLEPPADSDQTTDEPETADFTLPPMEPGELAGTNPSTSLEGDATLQTLIQEHQLWLDSQGAEGKRAVFREDNLAGTDLSHQRLSGASFRGLNLTNCKFTQAQLAEADFGDCQLQGADFTAALLDNANFQQVTAGNAAFSAAQMQEIDFGGAELRGSNFTQAKMQNANFRDADLAHANLQQVTANLANFRNAQMQEATLKHGDFTQAIFREANLTQANFEGAEVVHAGFKDAILSHVDLNSADFSQAQEISAEVQAQFMQVERAKLHNEMQKLDQIRDELEQRERSLIAEREDLQRQLHMGKMQSAAPSKPLADTDATTAKLQKSSRLFLFFGIGWFILCFLLAIVLQSVFAELDSDEISLGEMLLMGILMLVPLVFFVVSMSKCFSISYALRKMTPIEPGQPQ